MMASEIAFLILWFVYQVSAQRCPPEENLAPACSCRAFDSFSMLSCSNIMNAEELIPPIKATDGYDIMSINIEDSSLLYVPSELFRNTKYEKIRFGNSQVMSLSDSDLAFVGLEDRLEEIRATGANYVTTWDWSQLRNHKKLKVIDINMISMYSLDNEFPNLETMTALGISKAEISFIHPKAFQGMPNLDLLILKHNEIKQMSRSMLPNPANKMYHIDLSNNELSELPENMFTHMPNLKELKLNDNKFITLNEETFKWVFYNLQSLILTGNEFRCDCRLRWMVGIKTPLYFQSACSEPESMQGNNMRYMKFNELWC